MEFKLVISSPKDGRAYQREIESPEADKLLNKKIGDTFRGELIDLKGYKFEITGGSDDCGFPMRPDVYGTSRVKALIENGVGIRSSEKGERKRKSVRGNTVSQNISQINLKVVKYGDEPLGDREIEEAESSEEAEEEETGEEPEEEPEESEEDQEEEETEEETEESEGDEEPEDTEEEPSEEKTEEEESEEDEEDTEEDEEKEGNEDEEESSDEEEEDTEKEDQDEEEEESEEDEGYYCEKCERNHRAGSKIWEKHKDHKSEE